MGFIFVILGFGAGDPQVPTGRGIRLGFEDPPKDTLGAPLGDTPQGCPEREGGGVGGLGP